MGIEHMFEEEGSRKYQEDLEEPPEEVDPDNEMKLESKSAFPWMKQV